jgi:cellulose synthase/poly-beta-1,6-N-acetylglucosamine synthase-like glycosyltransferase
MEHTTVKAPKKTEIWTLRAMIVLGVFNMAYFFIWFARPEHIAYLPLYIPIAAVLLFQLLRILHEWYHYFMIRMPEEPYISDGFQPTVDILTTYFPGEPYDMIENTLLAIKNITYPHETWLCDEGNDPRLKEFCSVHGIHHVTRDNRKDAKAGNINNALQFATGEICVILDPDHVPHPDFLDPVIPHFTNPDVGFVQIVQAYQNFDESFVAKGAAQQTFQFYGPMMMSMNAYGTVMAIGANCTFRRKALDSIGGHAPGLAEDMHTAMRLHAEGWKSVYVPRILARGLVPSTLHGYFMQQLKWSRGTWDLLIHVFPGLFGKLNWRQRLHYLTAPFYYFSGIIYFFNFLIPILCLVFAILPWKGDFLTFLLLSIPLFASTILIRHYVQRWVMEEKERGFHVLGGILQVGTWWVHAVGIIYTFIGKKVPYLPTPKDNEGRSPWSLLLPNLLVAIFSIAAVIYGLSYDWNPFAMVMAGIAFINFLSMLIVTYIGLSSRRSLAEADGWSPMNAFLWSKRQFWHFRHIVYKGLRFGGLTILLILTLAMINLRRHDQKVFFDLPDAREHSGILYSGAYVPKGDNGLSNLSERDLSRSLVSFYLPWRSEADPDYLERIYASGRLPMITWEPWIPEDDTLNVFQGINTGLYDEFIRERASFFASLNRPIMLRFAHEMDNPAYQWSENGSLKPLEFIEAWRHMVMLFKKEGATNVLWVYNPWKADALDEYFPGGKFVDWIGVTLLDYGPHLEGKSYSFEQLYEPYHKKLTAYPGVPDAG